MKPILLIVEDDLEIARLLGILLEAEGFEHAHCSSAEEALRRYTSIVPALIILDVMLPGQDGLWCCRQLRDRGYTGGILMLTASEGDITEVVALNGGANDYLQKPIRPHVLIARIRALLRRDISRGQQHRLAGGFELNTATRELRYNNEPVSLTEAEFDLLALLASVDGPISREACFTQLRGIAYDGSDRAIDMRVSTLRKKLAQFAPRIQVVRTLRAQGYQVMKET